MYPTILKDRYELEDILGEGGMGTVYRCRDIQTGRLGAAKFLTLDQILSESGMRRFSHECQILSSINHPNIVRIYDHGVEEGFPYLIMELCVNSRGVPYTLKHLQMEQTNRRMQPDLLLNLLPPILDAVGLIHQYGLIHRDIKPDNVLLHFESEDRIIPKLTDFGLVALTGDDALRQQFHLSIDVSMQDSSRRNKAFVGTYTYMSPEQKRGDLLDARSDVYSLGLVIYRMATGYERLNPELPSDVNEEFPEWLDELVETALDDEPEGRYESAAAMFEFLPEEIREAHRKWAEEFGWRPEEEAAEIAEINAAMEAAVEAELSVETYDQVVPAAQATELDLDAEVGVNVSALEVDELISSLDLGDRSSSMAEQAELDEIKELAELARDGRDEDDDDDDLDAMIDKALASVNAMHRDAVPPPPPLPEIKPTDSSVIRRVPSGSIKRADVPGLGNRHTPIPIPNADGQEYGPTGTQKMVRVDISAVPKLVEALNGSNESARRIAERNLLRFGAGEVPALIDLFISDEPATRHAAVVVIERIGEPAIMQLIQALKNRNEQVRDLAVEALGRIGSPAIPNLVQSLINKSSLVRIAAIQALGKMEINEAALAILPALRDQSPEVRATAVEVLSGIEGNEEIAAALAGAQSGPKAAGNSKLPAPAPASRLPASNDAANGDASAPDAASREESAPLINTSKDPMLDLESDDFQVRIAAMERLGRERRIAAAPALVAALKDKNWRVRGAAGMAIDKIGKAAIPALIDALQEPDWSVRGVIVETLGKIGGDAAIPALIRASDDDDPGVRKAAAESLAKGGRVVLPANICEDISSQDLNSRREALEELSSVNFSGTIGALARLLRDDDWTVRSAAAEAIGSLPEVRLSIALNLAMSDRYESIRLAARSVLDRISALDPIEALIDALDDRDWRVRMAVTEALISQGEAIVPRLTDASVNREDNIKFAAADVLERLREAQ